MARPYGRCRGAPRRKSASHSPPPPGGDGKAPQIARWPSGAALSRRWAALPPTRAVLLPAAAALSPHRAALRRTGAALHLPRTALHPPAAALHTTAAALRPAGAALHRLRKGCFFPAALPITARAGALETGARRLLRGAGGCIGRPGRAPRICAGAPLVWSAPRRPAADACAEGCSSTPAATLLAALFRGFPR